MYSRNLKHAKYMRVPRTLCAIWGVVVHWWTHGAPRWVFQGVGETVGDGPIQLGVCRAA